MNTRLRTRFMSLCLSFSVATCILAAHPAAAGKLTALVWDNQKAYFFKDGSYIRYDIANDYAAPGYPRPIQANWNGLVQALPNGIDAAVKWNNGFAYFFKGNGYVKYNMDPKNEGVEHKHPRPIKGNWKGLGEAFPNGIDAAIAWNDGFAYFFKGTSYVKYNMDPKNEGVEADYPRAIKGNWKGLAEAFPNGIDAAVAWTDGFAYFFKGDSYVKYNMDPKKEGVEYGYPRIIKGNWCGLFGGPFGDPDATIHYSQPANFYIFDTDPTGSPHTTTSPGNGMFKVYSINSIHNHSPLFGGTTFNFTLANLFATKRDERSGSTSFDSYLKSAPDQLTVTSDASFLGTIVVRVAGDPQSLKTASVPLHYCAPDVNVSVVRSDPNQNPPFIDPMTPAKAAQISN